MRWIILACFVLGAVVIALLFDWRWNSGVDFKVETMSLLNGKPVFRSGGLTEEDCVGIASEIRAHESSRLSLVIVDKRIASESSVYAFSKEERGVRRSGATQHTLRPSGSDLWKLMSVSSSVDPRKEAIEMPLPQVHSTQ